MTDATDRADESRLLDAARMQLQAADLEISKDIRPYVIVTECDRLHFG